LQDSVVQTASTKFLKASQLVSKQAIHPSVFETVRTQMTPHLHN